jgi:hypothetical protein
MLSVRQTDAIGQICNDTWGKTSTPKSASSSIKVKLTSATTLSLTYTTIVTFASESSLHEQRRKLDEESSEIINARSKEVKKLFKEMTGDGLKLTEISSDDSLEMIYFNQYTPLRRAYYRRRAIFEIG